MVGRRRNTQNHTRKNSLHEKTTENGLLPIDLAREKNKIIKSAQFERNNLHMATRRSTDANTTTNQIYHVLIEKDEERVIIKIRIYRGLDADTDHTMVEV